MPAENGRVTQALILSSEDPAEALAEARRLAAAAVCTAAGKRPCGVCRACRKAAADIHPDIITVRRQTDDKGRLRREITVDQIRRMAADAVVLPNEAERKVYIIEEADKMNVQAQNAALKLLEEPPAGVSFLLCAANAALLLPTVRSRCAERRVGVGESPADDETAALAEGYLKALAAGDPGELLRWCTANENIDGRQAAAFAACGRDRIADMLCGRADALGLTRPQLLRAAALLAKCAAYLRVNVGVKHIFGLLAVDSPAGGEMQRKES